MRKGIKSILVLGMIVILVVAFAGCGGSSSTSKQPDVYKIGALFPMTGSGAGWGELMRAGATLAAEDINAAGGINGHKIEVVFEDSKGTPKDGVMALQKLMQVDKVPGFVATISGVVMAAIPVVNQGDSVLVNCAARGSGVVGAGKHVFSIVSSTTDEGIIQADFAFNHLKAKTAVMLYSKNELGVSFERDVKKRFEELGGTMLTTEGHDQGSTDFRAVLTKIKQLNPDVIFLETSYQEDGSIIKQAAELGIKTRYISYDGIQVPQFSEIAGSAAEGVFSSVAGWDPTNQDPEVQNFIKKYRAKYNKDPEILGAMCYDGVRMIAEAIKLGGYSAEGITKGLEQIKEYNGATGHVGAFTDKHTVNKNVNWTIFQGGKWVPYKQ